MHLFPGIHHPIPLSHSPLLCIPYSHSPPRLVSSHALIYVELTVAIIVHDYWSVSRLALTYASWSRDSNSVPGCEGLDSRLFFPVFTTTLIDVPSLSSTVSSFLLRFDSCFSLLGYSMAAFQLDNISGDVVLRHVFPAKSCNTVWPEFICVRVRLYLLALADLSLVSLRCILIERPVERTSAPNTSSSIYIVHRCVHDFRGPVVLADDHPRSNTDFGHHVPCT